MLEPHVICDLQMAADDLWSVYGKSLKAVDSCKRQFTATLNRTRVFEVAITRTLQQSVCAVNKCVSDASAEQKDSRSYDDGRDGHVVVMLNCPVLAQYNVSDMTATHLRQLLVSQHIQALLADTRSVLVNNR